MPYITENGEVGHDEVNRIVAGGNYGNPVAEGYAQKPGFIDPVWETGVGRIAPSGATFYTGTAMPEYTGDFFFCSFNTGDLTRMRFGGPNFDQIVAHEVLQPDLLPRHRERAGRLAVHRRPDHDRPLRPLTPAHRSPGPHRESVSPTIVTLGPGDHPTNRVAPADRDDAPGHQHQQVERRASRGRTTPTRAAGAPADPCTAGRSIAAAGCEQM